MKSRRAKRRYGAYASLPDQAAISDYGGSTLTGRSPTAETATRLDTGVFRSRLRDARIRSKLGFILIIPLIAVIVLAAIRLVDSGQRAIAADLMRSLAEVSTNAADVSHELHHERMAAARLLADSSADPGDFSAQAQRTDQSINTYLASRSALGTVPVVVADRLGRVDQQLDTLDVVRDEVLAGSVTLSAAMLRYGVVMSDVVLYQESVSQASDDPELAESIRAVTALSKAKVQMSESQTAAMLALRAGDPDPEQLISFLASQTGQQEALLAFELSATPKQSALVNSVITGGTVTLADRAANSVTRSVGGTPLISATAAADALGAVVDVVRWGELQLYQDQLALATELRDAVLYQVLIESALVLLTLVIAITVAVLLARMLVRSLGRLRENALYVAERELPETVARLSDPDALGDNTPEELADQVREPIQAQSRDEIGEVAQAFNVVHRSAVRVAAEQAALRTSVSAMFLSLARRSQSLVDRMISQLDEIERNEEDPKRLSRMFVLDHLATRMRRNDENLLVLAGADSSPPRTEDALVADALRAAQSEVEHYDRIEFGTVDADVSVVAGAVNDVVRLVAELFDNATRFSPPGSPVVAEARRLGDQVIVQIEDRGLGMSQEQANRINAWLASPPAVEVTTFRRMGLAVVARLAARHQIRVELRCDPNLGTVAYVALPRSILVLPQSRVRGPALPAPRRAPQVESEAAPPPVPARHLGQLPKRSPTVMPPPMSHPGTTINEDTQVDLPVAGRSLYEMTSRQPAAAPTPTPAPTSAPASTSTAVPEATVELPIFREMEAVWFRSHGKLDLGPEMVMEQQAGGRPARPAAAAVSEAPATTDAGSEEWRTAADAGWRAASAAAQPTSGGETKSGLPKRVPQAQLVPGSVESQTSTSHTQRRSPDEIRGLLSAYHRGVQRGRSTGTQPQ